MGWAIGLGVILLAALPALADGERRLAEDPKTMVYKSPTCGCCAKWVSHLQDKGFEVETTDASERCGRAKRQLRW